MREGEAETEHRGRKRGESDVDEGSWVVLARYWLCVCVCVRERGRR